MSTGTAAPLFKRALAAHRAGRLGEAAALYRELIASDAANAFAHHNLGIILYQRGSLDDAALELAKAIELKPQDAMFHSSLSAVQRARRQPDEARRSAERALGLQPRLADAQLNLGLALLDLKRPTEAGRCLETALAIDSKNVDVLAHLGRLRLAQKRFADAEQLLAQAIRLRPQDPRAYIWFGDVLAAQSRSVGALEAYRRAQSIAPGNTEALQKYSAALAQSGGAAAARESPEQAVAAAPDSAGAHELLGEFLSAHGFIDDAAASFRRALALDPDRAAPRASLAQITRIGSADDPDFVALQQAYARSDPQSPARDGLAFAMGKAMGELGDYDKSFDYLAEGNRLRRAQIDYALQRDAHDFAELRRSLSADFIARHRGEGDPTPAPIFIVGMPRSGTTLVEQIISAHADVYAGGELDFARLAATTVLGFDPLAEAARFAAAGARFDFAAVAKTYLGWLPAEAASKSRFTDKMPHNFSLVGLLRLIFPNSRIVHTIRDPVETCLSIYKTPFAGAGLGFSHDLSELGRYYNLYRRQMQHWQSVLPGEIYEIRYEDLVTAPEAAGRALFAFCGLEWTPEILDFHGSRREVRTASFAQVRRPVYTDSLAVAARYGARLDPLRAALAEWDPMEAHDADR